MATHQRDDEHDLPHPQATARVGRARGGPAARRPGRGAEGELRAAPAGRVRGGAAGISRCPLLVRVARPEVPCVRRCRVGRVRRCGRVLGVVRSRCPRPCSRGARRAVGPRRRVTGRRSPVPRRVVGRRRSSDRAAAARCGRRPVAAVRAVRRSRCPPRCSTVESASELVPPVASGPSPSAACVAASAASASSATGFTAATAAASTDWGAAAKDVVDGASGAGGVTPPPSPGGAAATGGATAAAGSPTTVVVPSAATTSRAGSLAGTMPSSVARWASAGGDCRAATSRCSRSLRSLRSRAAARASCSRYESAAAAVDSHSVATSPIPSSTITVSTNWARPGATARATVRAAGRARCRRAAGGAARAADAARLDRRPGGGPGRRRGGTGAARPRALDDRRAHVPSPGR